MEPEAPWPDAPWEDIAQLYRDPSLTVAEIADRYGLKRAELLAGARARGWPSRRQMAKAGRSAETRKPGPVAPKGASAAAAAKKEAASAKAVKPAKAAKPVRPLGLVKRIYNTIDKELTKLEGHKGASSQDRERASRALSQMVTSLEKAVEMQREITREQGRKDTSGKDKEALKHAEELRREIADRLERLHRKRAAQK